jgi:phosphohistidine phosphatase
VPYPLPVRLVIVRHATALPHGTGGLSDEDRPLNEEGEREAVHVGRALGRIGVKPTAFVTSPLVRARRTAELAAAELDAPVVEDPALAGGFRYVELPDLLERHPGDPLVLVGHDPDLSDLVHRLTGAQVSMPKAGIAAVELPARDAVAGELRWLLRPKQVHALAGES